MKTLNPLVTKSFRRLLRQQPISCERILWQKIRNQQLGYKFRRQYGISSYVVDFYCPELKLIIEIDGATHGTESEIAHDLIRQEYLETLGLNVKRYLNVDIKNNLPLVLENIIETCNHLKASKY